MVTGRPYPKTDVGGTVQDRVRPGVVKCLRFDARPRKLFFRETVRTASRSRLTAMPHRGYAVGKARVKPFIRNQSG